MYTFTIHILGQYLISSKLFDTEEKAKDALNEYLEITQENFPKLKITGFIHYSPYHQVINHIR
jgi:hypothetical protein